VVVVVEDELVVDFAGAWVGAGAGAWANIVAGKVRAAARAVERIRFFFISHLSFRRVLSARTIRE